MAKSAKIQHNDYRFKLKGVLTPPHPACVLSWSEGRKSPVGSRGKASVGIGLKSQEAQAFLLIN